ncbi:hypothetical protein CGRA01v4_13260 [Colletotrichum graminicola]|nr:hypothetical protein CGRA01v4_13260 [Colletotrichum graminicola]
MKQQPLAITRPRTEAEVSAALSFKLSKFLQQHQLLTPNDWRPTVGIADWALGGGYGYASAILGALRGDGNGNFGIVEIQIKLYPQTGFLAGFLGFPAVEAGDVLTNHPPPGAACATVIHTAHGRALDKKLGPRYPLRTRDRIAAISAGIVDATAQAAEYEEYKNWAATYGEGTVARLKEEVKKKLDPANVFKNGHPQLGLL